MRLGIGMQHFMLGNAGNQKRHRNGFNEYPLSISGSPACGHFLGDQTAFIQLLQHAVETFDQATQLITGLPGSP